MQTVLDYTHSMADAISQAIALRSVDPVTTFEIIDEFHTITPTVDVMSAASLGGMTLDVAMMFPELVYTIETLMGAPGIAAMLVRDDPRPLTDPVHFYRVMTMIGQSPGSDDLDDVADGQAVLVARAFNDCPLLARRLFQYVFGARMRIVRLLFISTNGIFGHDRNESNDYRIEILKAII